jgi:hypothetical protein
LPRTTGDVRSACDVTSSTAPCPAAPSARRRASVTRRNCGP